MEKLFFTVSFAVDAAKALDVDKMSTSDMKDFLRGVSTSDIVDFWLESDIEDDEDEDDDEYEDDELDDDNQ